MACTIPAVQPEAEPTPRFFGCRLNSNLLWSAWLPGVEPGTGFDSQEPQCKDLTLPREVGMFFLFPGLTCKEVLPSTPAPDVREYP